MTAAPGRTDIRLAGSGGQGVVLAGVILAEAAMRGGNRVVQSQAYGPQSRGGASRTDVVIGPDIGFPVTDELDILVALTRDAFDRYAGRLRGTGLLLADRRRVGAAGEHPWRAYLLPIEETARRSAGSVLAANMVALGALAGLTGVVTVRALHAAARQRVPSRTWPDNQRALLAGFELGQALVGSGAGRVPTGSDAGEVPAGSGTGPTPAGSAAGVAPAGSPAVRTKER